MAKVWGGIESDRDVPRFGRSGRDRIQLTLWRIHVMGLVGRSWGL